MFIFFLYKGYIFEIYRMNKTSKQIGLRNYGFNCFINTTLQCLKNCDSIHNELFINDKEDNDILDQLRLYIDNTKNGKNNDINIEINDTKRQIDRKLLSYFNVYFMFKKLIIALRTGDEKTMKPDELFMACKDASQHKFMEHLFNGTQNDIQEFLIFILDILHESKSYTKSINVPEKTNNNIETMIKIKTLETFKQHFEKSYSWIVKDFYFLNLNITKCSKCCYSSLTYEPKNILLVPIPSERDVSIYDCFDHYFGKDVFSEGEEWKCEKCENKKDNYKECRLIDSPKTLIIVIKRFYYNNGWRRHNQLVNFPEILNISPYVIGSNKNITYTLMSTGNHIGSLSGGHYYAYCKEGGDWLCYNDENIKREGSFNDIVSKSTYLLFYKKNVNSSILN